MSTIADNHCYLLSEIGDIRHQCRQVRRSCFYDDNRYSSFGEFLAGVFGKPLNEILQILYVDRQMSSQDIREKFLALFGFSSSVRMVHLLLVEAGVPLRGRAECKALSWKQGKMDASVAKTRQGLKRAYVMGSSAEKKVRYLLREAVIALNPPWEIIIGDHFQHIDRRFEIDIPIVIIDPETLSCFRVAVEIDSVFTHTAEGDLVKTASLEQKGWSVLRCCGDRFSNKSVLAETVTDLAMEIYRQATRYFDQSRSSADSICSSTRWV